MLIATDSYEKISQDYILALDWIRTLGVRIGPGRTQFYAKVIESWAKNYRTASDEEAKNIFPDFLSSALEIMDFTYIYKSLCNVPAIDLKSIADKLQKGVNGPTNLIEESSDSSVARNFIFEALVTAEFHRPYKSIEAIFDTSSDAGLKIEGRKILIECKRITSLDKLEANVRKACSQLESSLEREVSSRNRGLVALDFTKNYSCWG